MTATDRDELAEFVFLQARPAIIFSRPPVANGATTEPLAPIRHLDTAPVDIEPGLAHITDGLRYPDEWISSEPDVWRAVQCLLAASGHQRYEPCNTYNTHRGFPSAQSAVPTEVFLRTERGGWHFDADRHQLRAVTGQGHPRDALGGAASVVIAGRPGTLPSYYRELRWALTLCELGHVAELLAALAPALGLPGRLRTSFDDRAVLADLGAEPGDAWLPGAVLELTDSPVRRPAPDVAWPDAVDPVLAADRCCWKPGVADPVRATPAEGTTIDLPSFAPPAVSWAETIFQRTSGRGIGGFAAAPEQLPLTVLADALHAARTAATTRWGDTNGPMSGLRMMLVVERIAGLADGLYEWPLANGPLRLLRPGRLLADVQHAYFYPRAVTRVDSCNVAAMLAVNYDNVLRERGARGLRVTQLELGGVAQAAMLAMSNHDTFLRPSRSFDTDRLATLAGLPKGTTVGYLCIGGRSRLHDLLLDLRI